MEKFSFIRQSEENNEYDEWEVKIISNPELQSAIALDMGSVRFFLTPIANVIGNQIIIDGVNGTGSNFSFKIPKGETPISYKIKIQDKIITYSETDNDFKPAERIIMR